MEAGHKNNIPRGLEADDALLLAFVLDGSASFFLGDLRGAASTPSTRRLDGRSIAPDAESRTFAVAAARASLSSASLAESHRAGATSSSRSCSTSGRPVEDRWRSSARASAIRPRMVSTVSRRPRKIASPIRKWPIFSSAISGMAATGFTVS